MSQRVHIALVNPTTSPSFASIDCTFSSLPPMVSLPLLACETERRSLEASGHLPSIHIYDRPRVDDIFLAKVAQSDVLGLSTWFSNYESAIVIASLAKALNPTIKVVLGGPNATNLGIRCLLNRNSVDYLVTGDGEDVLWRLAAGQSTERIHNLWYRDSCGIPRFTRQTEIDLNSIAPFDLSHVDGLDLTTYDSRNPDYRYSPTNLPISLVWIRGCPKAVNQGRCGYCSIPDRSLRCMNAINAWDQLRRLYEKYGIISFFEGGDDLSCGAFAEDLAKSKSVVSGIHLRGYSSLWRLTERKLEAFCQIGVKELFVGLETADPVINNWSGHKISRMQILSAFSRIHKHGISVCMPLLFGLPYESLSSLGQSETMVYELVERFDNIRMVLISVAVPLIGSPWFSQLLKDQIVRAAYDSNDLSVTDIPDYNRLSELSIQRFCSVTQAQIASTVERLRTRLAGRVTIGSFGALVKVDKAGLTNPIELAHHPPTVIV